MSDAGVALRTIFVTGLRNAHALEHLALSLIDRQVEHLASYQEVEARLRAHRRETENQIKRLETILQDLGETHSGVKNMALSIGGSVAAIAHGFSADEILRNSFSNAALETFEASTYKSLIVMAEDIGFPQAVPLLRQSLQEEMSMAAFMEEAIPIVTRRFMALTAAGEPASH